MSAAFDRYRFSKHEAEDLALGPANGYLVEAEITDGYALDPVQGLANYYANHDSLYPGMQDEYDVSDVDPTLITFLRA